MSREQQQQELQAEAAALQGDEVIVPFRFFGARSSGNALIRNTGFRVEAAGRVAQSTASANPNQ